MQTVYPAVPDQIEFTRCVEQFHVARVDGRTLDMLVWVIGMQEASNEADEAMDQAAIRCRAPTTHPLRTRDPRTKYNQRNVELKVDKRPRRDPLTPPTSPVRHQWRHGHE